MARPAPIFAGMTSASTAAAGSDVADIFRSSDASAVAARGCSATASFAADSAGAAGDSAATERRASGNSERDECK